MKLSAEYGGNILMNWIVSGIVYVFVFSVLSFNYIYVVYDFIAENFNLYGYILNKFGFAIVVCSLFYIVKGGFSYLFFIITGSKNKWRSYLFTINKFFYFANILICILIVIYYFYPIDQDIFFKLSTIFFILSFLFKIILLLTSSNNVLPKEWYYKFLYICVLQILPYLIVGILVI